MIDGLSKLQLITIYGPRVVHALNAIFTISRKLGRLENHLRFLHRCRDTGIIPNGLRINCGVQTLSAQALLRRTSFRLLNERLAVCHAEKRKFVSDSVPLLALIDDYLEDGHAITFNNRCRAIYNHEFRLTKQRQLKKYAALCQQQKRKQTFPEISKEVADRVVCNMSTRVLTEDEKEVIALGPKFAVVPEKVPVSNIIASLESSLSLGLVPVEVKEQIFGKVASLIKSERKVEPNLSKRQARALKSIKREVNNEHIVILPADKGSASVVLDRTDYNAKMEAALADPKTYSKLDKSPLLGIRKKLVSILAPFRQRHLISKGLYRKLIPSAERCSDPYAHATVKLHKEDKPLRIIIGTCGSITYELAKFLSTNVIAKVVGNSDCHLEDTKHFIEQLPDSFPDGFMASFDVTSLFTNVPTDEILTMLKDRLEARVESCAEFCLPVDTIMECVKLCLDSTYFSFNGRLYQQQFGCPMGSPLSPLLCSMFMEEFYTSYVTQMDTQPHIWKRYVDDVFIFWTLGEDSFKLFFEELNRGHPSIKFTYEVESNNVLSFLDVEVHRQDVVGDVSLSVFRKKTHTGRYSNFYSNLSLSVKAGIIKTLVARAMRICAFNYEALNKELSRLRDDFVDNGYPISFVNKQISQQMKKGINNHRQQEQDKSIKVFLPYVKGISESIASFLRSKNILTVFCASNKLSSSFYHKQPKGKIEDRCNVVYELSCKQHKVSYVGKTERQLKYRVREHQKCVKDKNVEGSALAEHTVQYSCEDKIDWSGIKVLDSDRNWFKLAVKEALHIKSGSSQLNREEGMIISNTWNTILHCV